MNVAYKTDVGLRRSNNEDALFVSKRDKLFIVADGVGGNNSGELASKLVTEGTEKFIELNPLNGIKELDDVRNYFGECIGQLNFQVIKAQHRFDENRGMATTCVLVYIVDNIMYTMNVGDSRAYVYRDGSLTQITEDHTYINKLLKAGIITKEEAENHEKKNMITRAIGADVDIKADFFVTTLKVGDIVLLSSDGLHSEVSKEEIEQVFTDTRKANENIDAACEKLVRLAKENGGNDNITVICIDITEEDIHE